ncbi:MAG: hypothetical protein AB199_01735 [Parcubacteria bacterium C7867-004]|nr:MAG: hypothetical protein AB199_01735 [Parcubacteria bacterium C7867-004]
MLFGIEMLESDDPRQVCHIINGNIGRQHIVCLFETEREGCHPIYTFEDLLSHDALYMQEIRASNPAPEYQAFCDEYERLRSQNPSNAQLLMGLLLQDLQEGYPDISTLGFDLGVCVIPADGQSTLIQGGTLAFGFYPREQVGQPAHQASGWPFEQAPAILRLPVGEEDPGVFWGLVGAGISPSFVVLNPEADTNWERRRDAFLEILSQTSGIPLFVENPTKHCFLNHALNCLVEYLNRTLAEESTPVVVALSDEAEVKFGDGKVLQFTPRPRLRTSAA